MRIHSRREAMIAVFLPGPGGQGNHGQSSLPLFFPFANDLDDPEAVEIGHVEVEQ